VVSATIGTSGVVFAATDRPAMDPQGRLHTFCHAAPHRWHLMGVTQAAGLSLRWLRDQLGARDDGYDSMIAEAARVPAGADGVLWAPYLMGERTPHCDPNARAALVGLAANHTRGHIVYFFPQDDVAFVGDTLFSLGCGRLFEGTPAQMWSSLTKIMSWPERTRLYCAHEYTQANGRFAVTVEPGNRALAERVAEVAKLRAAGKPTVPSTLALEKATNPFLRPASRNLRETIGLAGASDVEVFAKTRALKDAF